MHDKGKEALFTFTVRISVGRKRSDVVVCDEGIAPAMSEEQNATDDPFAVHRKLTAKVNKAGKENQFCLEDSMEYPKYHAAKRSCLSY